PILRVPGLDSVQSMGVSGIVDQDVDLGEGGRQGFQGRIDRIPFPYIKMEQVYLGLLPQFPQKGLQALPPSPTKDQTIPLLGKKCRGRPSNSTGRPGDQGCLFHVQSHFLSRFKAPHGPARPPRGRTSPEVPVQWRWLPPKGGSAPCPCCRSRDGSWPDALRSRPRAVGSDRPRISP